MTLTWLLHSGRMTHLTITQWSHDCHLTITQWSHDCHLTITQWSHDLIMIVFLRGSSTSCLWCKWLPTVHGKHSLVTSPRRLVSATVWCLSHCNLVAKLVLGTQLSDMCIQLSFSCSHTCAHTCAHTHTSQLC